MCCCLLFAVCCLLAVCPFLSLAGSLWRALSGGLRTCVLVSRPSMSFTPLRSHSGTPGFTNPNRSTTFAFRLDGLDDENAPPDPTMGADAIIPSGIILVLNHTATFLLTRYTLSFVR